MVTGQMRVIRVERPRKGEDQCTRRVTAKLNSLCIRRGRSGSKMPSQVLRSLGRVEENPKGQLMTAMKMGKKWSKW